MLEFLKQVFKNSLLEVRTIFEKQRELTHSKLVQIASSYPKDKFAVLVYMARVTLVSILLKGLAIWVLQKLPFLEELAREPFSTNTYYFAIIRLPNKLFPKIFICKIPVNLGDKKIVGVVENAKISVTEKSLEKERLLKLGQIVKKLINRRYLDERSQSLERLPLFQKSIEIPKNYGIIIQTQNDNFMKICRGGQQAKGQFVTEPFTAQKPKPGLNSRAKMLTRFVPESWKENSLQLMEQVGKTIWGTIINAFPGKVKDAVKALMELKIIEIKLDWKWIINFCSNNRYENSNVNSNLPAVPVEGFVKLPTAKELLRAIAKLFTMLGKTPVVATAGFFGLMYGVADVVKELLMTLFGHLLGGGKKRLTPAEISLKIDEKCPPSLAGIKLPFETDQKQSELLGKEFKKIILGRIDSPVLVDCIAMLCFYLVGIGNNNSFYYIISLLIKLFRKGRIPPHLLMAILEALRKYGLSPAELEQVVAEYLKSLESGNDNGKSVSS